MEEIPAADGRRLAVDSWGAIDGKPIFLLHGTPGSRSGPRPRASVLYRLGVRLICYDRPGYGGSGRHKGRRVADAAWDVLAIADSLGLKKFGVVGRSGGGPHALACAALLEDRVTAVAALVSAAPPDADELDWFAGMTNSNIDEYSKASVDAASVASKLSERAAQIRADPEVLVHDLMKEMTDPDRRIVGDFGMRKLLTDTYSEALRNGADGWIDDALALSRPWGFELSSIAVPVLLWHGKDDVFHPVTHTQWLSRKIQNGHPARNVLVDIQPGAAHFDAVEILPEVLVWVKDPLVQNGCGSSARISLRSWRSVSTLG
jgi:pimeloyl-ACP methyl ester carboxylesterase